MSAKGRLNLPLALAAAAAAAAIYFATGGKYESVTSVQPISDSSEPEEIAVAPSPSTPSSAERIEEEPPAAMTREVPGDPGEPPILPALALHKGELPWERRLREITDNNAITESNKARLILELLPGLPVEGRQPATEEALRRLPGEDYRFAQAVLLNPSTYPPALAVLWADLMERPEQVSLPTLLQVARNSAHPYAPYAVENLELLLGQNHGQQWPQWEAAIREKLNRK